jgi:hypothetical protein
VHLVRLLALVGAPRRTFKQKAVRRVIALWHKNKVNNKSLSPSVCCVALLLLLLSAAPLLLFPFATFEALLPFPLFVAGRTNRRSCWPVATRASWLSLPHHSSWGEKTENCALFFVCDFVIAPRHHREHP